MVFPPGTGFLQIGFDNTHPLPLCFLDTDLSSLGHFDSPFHHGPLLLPGKREVLRSLVS